MAVAIIIFLSASLIWLIYWALIRTSVLDAIEDDYKRMISTVEWNIIEGLPESQSRPAEKLLNDLRCYHATRWISVGHAIYARMFKASEIVTARAHDDEIFEGSPKWIRDCKEMDTRLVLKAALVNSPTWWIPLAIVLFASMFSGSIANWWKDVGKAASKSRTEALAA